MDTLFCSPELPHAGVFCSPKVLHAGVLGSASYRQTYRVLYCPAFPLTPESVVDTTGAGDAFIGGFLSTFCQPSRQNDLCGAMIMGTLTGGTRPQLQKLWHRCIVQ